MEKTLLSATFTDNARTSCLVLWALPDASVEEEHIIVDKNSTMWKEVLKHTTIDEIHVATYKQIRDDNEAFEKDVITIAKQRGYIYDVDSVNTEIYKAIASAIFSDFDPEQDKEKLFLTKLQIFEMDRIKKAKDRAIKSKIRKATTLVDAIYFACELLREEAKVDEVSTSKKSQKKASPPVVDSSEQPDTPVDLESLSDTSNSHTNKTEDSA